jgi:hypothetical protein
MRSRRAKVSVNPFPRDSYPYSHITAAMAVFLSKVAKHLALLACLLILGKAGGRLTIGPSAIFFLTLLASAAHLVGRVLAPRWPAGPFKSPP